MPRLIASTPSAKQHTVAFDLKHTHTHKPTWCAHNTGSNAGKGAGKSASGVILSGKQGREMVAQCEGALRSNELSDEELAGALPVVQQVSVGCVFVCVSVMV